MNILAVMMERQLSHGFNNKLQADQPQLHQGLYISNYSLRKNICPDAFHPVPAPASRDPEENGKAMAVTRRKESQRHIT